MEPTRTYSVLDLRSDFVRLPGTLESVAKRRVAVKYKPFNQRELTALRNAVAYNLSDEVDTRRNEYGELVGPIDFSTHDVARLLATIEALEQRLRNRA